MVVSRRDRRPVYQQIADDLLHEITTGRYTPGDELPTLAELCRTYQVSKATASSALTVLDHQGLIAIRHGLRPVVLPPAQEADLAQVRQQISAMTARQERIVAQVQSLENTLRGIQQQMHQLRQQDTLLPQPPESPPD